MNPEQMVGAIDMIFDPQDRHEENKIEAQALRNEWVDQAVKQQLKDGDFADEMFAALESLTHNDLLIKNLLRSAGLPVIDRYSHLGMTLYAQLEIECIANQEYKYDSSMNTK